jgi:hypothetical protein
MVIATKIRAYGLGVGSEILTPVSSQVDRVTFIVASGCPGGWGAGRAGTEGGGVRL